MGFSPAERVVWYSRSCARGDSNNNWKTRTDGFLRRSGNRALVGALQLFRQSTIRTLPLGRLTTHVLDAAHGCPGVGIALALYQEDMSRPLRICITDADGRCNTPLLNDLEMAIGRYTLSFEIGDYFRARGVLLPRPAFLETVRVDFGIADANANYHVPLLISPYGYSTYRGS